MKKLLESVSLVILGIIIVASGIWLSGAFTSSNTIDILGSAFDDRNTSTLLGSSSNYVSLPDEAVFANSTTTSSALADGSQEFQQMLNTGGIRKVILNFGVVAGTATSTAHIRQMGSNDGTNYYDLATSTAVIEALTTPISMDNRGGNFDAGVASTTISIPFEIDGYRYTRFVMYADEVAGDPNDGVQAWITATKIRDKEQR